MARPEQDAAVSGNTRIGPIEFAPGISRTNAWSYVYSALVVVALLGFLNFAQPYVLREIVKVPPGEIGRVTGYLTTYHEIIQLLLIGFVGGLSDRYGRRGLYAGGILLMGIGYALYPFAADVAQLFIYRTVFAIGLAMAGVLFGVIGQDYPAEGSRGKLGGLSGFLNGLGIAVAAVLFSRLPETFVAAGATPAQAGRDLFLSVAVLAVISAAIMRLGLKGGRPAEHHHRASLLQSIRLGVRHGLRNRRIMLCYAGGFMSRADLTIVATFISLWLQEVARNEGATAEEAIARAATLFALIQTASLLWAPAVGVLIDRFNRVACLLGALGLAAAGYLFLGIQEHPFEMAGLVGCVMVGMGQVSVIICVNVLLGQEAPVEVRGAVMGLSAFFGGVGILTTTFTGGFLFDHWLISGPVIFVGALNLLAFLLATWVWQKDGRPVRIDFAAIAASRGGTSFGH